MITNVIYGLMNYSGQDFSQAFYNEMVCVFRNRLIHATSLEMFDDIWQENCQKLISKTISNHTQYFAPTGAKMTDQQLVDSDEWQQIIQRNITTCGKNFIIYSITHMKACNLHFKFCHSNGRYLYGNSNYN